LRKPFLLAALSLKRAFIRAGPVDARDRNVESQDRWGQADQNFCLPSRSEPHRRVESATAFLIAVVYHGWFHVLYCGLVRRLA